MRRKAEEEEEGKEILGGREGDIRREGRRENKINKRK